MTLRKIEKIDHVKNGKNAIFGQKLFKVNFQPTHLWQNDQRDIAGHMSPLLVTLKFFEIHIFSVNFPNFLYLISCVLLAVER